VAACALVAGCAREDAAAARTVVAYCSVDEAFARQVFAAFEQRRGIRVEALLDSEAGKTTGLVNKLRAEATSPRADLFWSSEVFNTVLLADEGLFEPYRPPSAADIPPEFIDSQQRWTGLAQRARVIVFDPQRISRADVPAQWAALADAKWRGQVALANPQFGTTRGHVATMFALWGREPATAYLRALRDNEAVIADGNSAVVRLVISGRALLGMTDTDDVYVAQRDGASVELVLPDMGDGGTLWIPNTVAVVRGGPHPAEARELADFLVSAEVEEMLAASASGNIPVRAALREKLGLADPARCSLSYQEIAGAMDAAISTAREILLR
jgi:iron(III) transport system substrate-binding protein